MQESLPCQMRQVAAGVLHHLDQLDPIMLDHPSVHLDHLLGGEPRNFTAIDWECPPQPSHRALSLLLRLQS